MSPQSRGSWLSRRTAPKPPALPSRIDIWFSRLTSIAQVGLLGLTAWGLYYTVLPLYQKALLDETIAKKEIELRDLTRKEAVLYTSLRERILGQFLFSMGAECTGLLERQTFTRDATKDNIALTMDVGPCISKHVARIPQLSDLHERDRSKLFRAASEVIPEIVLLQKKHLNLYSSYEKRALEDPALLKPLPQDSALFQYVAILQNAYGASSARVMDALHNAQISSGRLAIAEEYGRSVRTRLEALQKLKFDTPKE